MHPTFLWAHRGASRFAPENTLAAFAAAEEAGADGIELDLHLSRDGEAVVIHDETLDRTTNGRGRVADSSLQHLHELDAGAWFSEEFRGEPLPLLDEVLAWAGGRLRLNLEIKSGAAGSRVLELLAHHPQARVLVSSFDHALLAWLRTQAPTLPLGFLSESRFWQGGLRRAVAAAAESFHPRADLVSRPLLRACHAAGLKVFPWTVAAPAAIRSLARLGVDGIFTNDPALARAHLPR